MIRDTCRCGADFDVTRKYFTDEWEAHHDWLQAHAPCRMPLYTLDVPTPTSQDADSGSQRHAEAARLNLLRKDRSDRA